MSKKLIFSLLVVFAFLDIAGYLFYVNLDKPKQECEKQKTKNVKDTKKSFSKKFKYRKYLHVKNFYKDIANGAIEIGLKYNVPPAAILAIAGVESGYGRGYVAKITGNILSLGAKKTEAELPALNLPNLKEDKSKIIYGDEIKKYPANALEWKKRPKSLKKDYRKQNIAGTTKELDYFDKHPSEKVKANLQCLEDFAKNWINKNKKFEPFVKARQMLDKEVEQHGKEILFSKALNEKFIYMISGKPNSFNYRKSWAKKVINIMENTGLVELVKSLHVEKKSFEEAW